MIEITHEHLDTEVVSITPKLAIRISDDATSMIKKEHLSAVIKTIEASIRQLWDGGDHIREVVVEREVDPEIEAREVLAVTVWMQNVSPERASSFWKGLLEQVNKLRAILSPDEWEKLNRLVSVGVDVE
mgnify:CR=1 FL=1